jgi:hypothetical protein
MLQILLKAVRWPVYNVYTIRNKGLGWKTTLKTWETVGCQLQMDVAMMVAVAANIVRPLHRFDFSDGSNVDSYGIPGTALALLHLNEGARL